MMTTIPTITFIGGGNMARNLVVGLIANGYDPHGIWVTNRTAEKLLFFRDQCAVHTTQNNKEGAKQADVIVLSVKPQQIKTVCEEIREVVSSKNKLIVSVALGVTTNMIQKWLGGNAAVVRAMPNTPASVHAGATGLFANAHTSADQKNLAESLLRAVGLVVWLNKEEQIDLVAALSGSGPAYIFLVMESLQNAAREMGVPDDCVGLLTAQTVLGAAKMALEVDQDVVQLRQFVTSPGGSTERAIKVLEAGHIRQLFSEALKAALNRAKELTQQLE